MKPSYSPTPVQQLRALHDTVLVTDMSFSDRRLSSGIILPNDNGKSEGIRPRWGRVVAVGPTQTLVRPGQWVLVSHGRWTRGIDVAHQDHTMTIRRIDPRDILLWSDQEPGVDDTMSDAVTAPQRQR